MEKKEEGGREDTDSHRETNRNEIRNTGMGLLWVEIPDKLFSKMN